MYIFIYNLGLLWKQMFHLYKCMPYNLQSSPYIIYTTYECIPNNLQHCNPIISIHYLHCIWQWSEECAYNYNNQCTRISPAAMLDGLVIQNCLHRGLLRCWALHLGQNTVYNFVFSEDECNSRGISCSRNEDVSQLSRQDVSVCMWVSWSTTVLWTLTPNLFLY